MEPSVEGLVEYNTAAAPLEPYIFCASSWPDNSMSSDVEGALRYWRLESALVTIRSSAFYENKREQEEMRRAGREYPPTEVPR